MLCFLLALAFCGCRDSGQLPSDKDRGADTEIIVSAAISLKDAFLEIAQVYEASTGAKVRFNFGASGVLQKQIEGGAPVDVFASAGEGQMDELAGKGLVDEETRADFARNTLVLIVPRWDSLRLRSFQDLDTPKLKRLAIGNPKTVPAGQYAQQLLTNLNLWSKLQPRLIPAEDVHQVLEYVARGEVEAGIIYSSDVATTDNRVSVVERAQETLHDPIRYPIAVIKESGQKKAAGRFVEFVLSAEGQGALRRAGFLAAR